MVFNYCCNPFDRPRHNYHRKSLSKITPALRDKLAGLEAGKYICSTCRFKIRSKVRNVASVQDDAIPGPSSVTENVMESNNDNFRSSGSLSSDSNVIEQHEINYTPSRWGKRYNHEEMLDTFFKYCGNVTAKARKTLKCDLDVPYGNSERTKYDVYGTDLPADAPILVFVHGGYWQEFSKDLAGFSVPAFVANGVKVINVGYDLCPKVRIGDIVSQIRNAIEQILRNAQKSGCRCVWVAGHSAGGHLVAGLIADRTWTDKMTEQGLFRLLKGLMLIGGIYYLKPLVTTSYNDALTLTDEEIRAYSFSKLESKHEPIQGLKVVVTVGECDSPVFVNEAREYAQKAVTLVDDVQYILIRESVDHFNIVEHLVNTDYILTKLLLDNLSGYK